MNNENHQVRDFPSSLMTGYETYTPGRLMDIAAEMTRAGVESIDLEVDHGYGHGDGSVQCRERRLETDKERDQRVERERADNQRREDWEHSQWLKLKTKYGITGG